MEQITALHQAGDRARPRDSGTVAVTPWRDGEGMSTAFALNFILWRPLPRPGVRDTTGAYVGAIREHMHICDVTL